MIFQTLLFIFVKNPNSGTKVNLEKLNLDLESLIKEMAKQTFNVSFL